MTGPSTLAVRPDTARAAAKRLDEAPQVCARHGPALTEDQPQLHARWRRAQAAYDDAASPVDLQAVDLDLSG